MASKLLNRQPGIDAAATIGMIALRVANLDRSLRFYTGVLGFRALHRESTHVLLGCEGGRPLLKLIEAPTATPAPSTATGLYHFAVLVPSRSDLGRMLSTVIAAGIPIGQSDHLVSEALYLSDPDGNGVELYRDRPRDEWRWRGGQVLMAVDPLDLGGLLAEASSDRRSWTGLPGGTVIGHVHLQVGDLAEAERFYHNRMGFDITCRFPGALFVSAGGYHHHIGLNVWRSRGSKPAPPGSVGLESFEVLLPDADAVAAYAAHLTDAGVPVEMLRHGSIAIHDPWGNAIVMSTQRYAEVGLAG